MGLPMYQTVELTQTECWCGIGMALPASLYTQAKEHKRTIYCPLGHTWVIAASETDRLRKQLAEAERATAWERERRATAEKQLTAAKGAATKLRKRIANGVCPDCHRHFTNLERHVASKHPAHAPATTEESR